MNSRNGVVGGPIKNNNWGYIYTYGHEKSRGNYAGLKTFEFDLEQNATQLTIASCLVLKLEYRPAKVVI